MLLKRLARVVATCGLLIAGYFGYCRAFAAIAAHVGTPDWRVIPYDPSPSRTLVQTQELARGQFGPGHWTSDPKKAICYYDAERGYWIFFQRYARKNGGQRIEFSPFAIIMGAKGKKNLNTLEGDLAYVDFDRPFDLVSRPGTEAARIVRGMIEGRVRLRDDKGTRDNPGDDLTVGPLLSVSYDEATHRIRSDSPFELRERDIVATATGLTIDLIPNTPPPGKPPGAASGFSGAKTVWLHQNIRIFCEDVGRVGVVPGGKQAKAGERRAGDLRCDGPAQFNLPEPLPKGTPPGPPRPVIAQFFRNVVVRQGPLVTSPQAGMALGSAADPPDQLNADQLELTLFPAEKPDTPPAPAPAPTTTASAGAAKPADPMAGLTLREAVAVGHAVWLQSPSEGLEARGNELRYEKRAPAQPDRIFFRGNRETKVEKVTRFAKGPKAGQVEAVDILRTLDVTIYLASKPGDTPTIIARGPGSMETRADRNLPVERSAEWGDKLTVQTVETSAGTRRRITLTGTPRVVSPTQGTITAQERIVAYLKPKERPAASAPPANVPPATGSPAATEAFQIDWVEGHGGVHMAAVPPPAGAPPTGDGLPGSSRNLKARKILYVVFAEPAAKPGAAEAKPGAAPPATIPGAALTPAPATAAADPKAPPKPPEPALSVEADEVWARVLLGSLHGKPELEEVRLRKGVALHQDPAPGKARGTDATGEAIDYVNRGEGRAWLEAHGTAAAPARVVTDTFLIEGPKLGVDQAADFAWVKGAGRMVQEGPPPAPQARTAEGNREVVPTAFRADEPAANGERPKGKAGQFDLAAKGPVTITWRQEMQFYGQPADTPDRNAWALFLGDVKVTTPDSSLSCGQMKAFLDGPVVFRRPTRGPEPGAPPEEKRPKPRIATVRCLKNVDLVHRQAGPDGKALQQKGRVTGQDVSYSLATGRFVVDGAGVVWLYKPKGEADGARGPLASPTPPGLQRTVATVARGEPDGGDRALFGSGAKARKASPLELTRVAFNKRVQGRVGHGDGGDNPQAPGGNAPFLAEFLGGVQVLNAPVAGEDADLDPDDPPGGFMMLTSEALKVVRELPPGPRPSTAEGAPPEAPAEQLFIDATGDPQALAPPRSIRGDRITYDSVKELVYVYGDEGGVSIINQDGAGQPFSASRGRAVMYNRKSGRIEFIDPKNVLLIDPRSGIRERPQPPGAARPAAPPRVRGPIRAVPGNDKERRGFNGR